MNDKENAKAPNENIVAKAINELEEEIKEMRTELTLNSNTVELYSKAIKEFEANLEKLEVTCHPPDITPFIQLVNKRMAEIKEAIDAKPVTVKHDVKYHFYPEGKFHEHVKRTITIFMRALGISIGIGSAVALTVLIISYFLQKDNENERFKYAYYYLYHEVEPSSKRYILKTFNKFESDSLFNLFKDCTLLTFDEPKPKPKSEKKKEEPGPFDFLFK
jgi:hypothetical protein